MKDLPKFNFKQQLYIILSPLMNSQSIIFFFGIQTGPKNLTLFVRIYLYIYIDFLSLLLLDNVHIVPVCRFPPFYWVLLSWIRSIDPAILVYTNKQILLGVYLDKDRFSDTRNLQRPGFQKFRRDTLKSINKLMNNTFSSSLLHF